MAIVYILGTFVCMLGMVASILIACYSLARGLWFAALICALLAMIALTFMLDAMSGMEREFDRVTAQIELQS